MTPTDRKILANVVLDGGFLPDDDAEWCRREVAGDPEAAAYLANITALKEAVHSAEYDEEAMPHAVEVNWQRFRSQVRDVRQGSSLWERLFGGPVLLGAAAALVFAFVGARIVAAYAPARQVEIRDVWSPDPGVTASVVPARGAGVIWLSGLEYRDEASTVR
jgi:anti-sigma factor RsiW